MIICFSHQKGAALNPSNKLLSDIVSFRTYAKYLSHLGRRESLEETINRNMCMHLDRFPKLSRDIVKAYQKVHELKVMPSMRAMQFSGAAILKNHARQYNCSYTPINDVRVFSEILYLLLSGVGVGFSVQNRHISQLPKIVFPKEEGFFVAHDSIMGWAQCVELLFEAYMLGRIKPQFDFGSIRPKGSYLVTTGAKAPGPEPLRKMLELVEDRLKKAIGRKLTSLEVHDIVCIISDAVLAGGIRRAALISLFDRDDKDMLTCKSGEWWNTAPWRARANNSAVLPRDEVNKEEFDHIFKMCKDSGSGEPGFSWTNNNDWGFNPCFTGDTLVAVADGRNAVSIGQLSEENWTGPIYTIQNGSVVVGHCSKVWKTRKDAQLIKITLDNGTSIRCTPDHLFMLRNGNYIKAKDLKRNTSLMPFNSYKRKDGSYRMISSNTGKDFAQYRYIAQYYDLIKEGFDKYHIHHKDNNGLNDRIDNLEIVLASEHNKEHMLGHLNPIHNFKNNDSYRKKRSKATTGNNNPNINGIDGEKMFELLCVATIKKGTILSIKEALSICGLKYVSKGRLREMGVKSIYEAVTLAHTRMNHKVIDIEFLIETEDVYDLTVDVTHNFAIITDKDNNAINSSGVFVHNCHEISLNANQFCNLTTINQTGITTEKDYFNRIYAATLIGTLQASYTDFDYLRPIWQDTTERESLLGISFTGIADKHNFITSDLLEKGAQFVLEINEKYAKKIGINLAARTTTIKPEGSSSCVLGSSSGIHARHSPYYIRRIRMNKDDALAIYLQYIIPELVETDIFSSNGLVVSIPQESPEDAITRENETTENLFKRAIMYNKHWIANGHRSGDNRHNVSVTISVKDNEWETLRELMWKYRRDYSGISLLPYDGGNYKQAPFEECSKDDYERMSVLVKEIDLKSIREEKDNTTRVEQIACGGGQCEIT
jgi:hypothetical protein